MNEELMLEKKLDFLRRKKQELENILSGVIDDFTAMRLKKEKLALRDQIFQIEKLVYPDVIA